MSTIKSRILKAFHKLAYRRAYVDNLTDALLATQIQVLREQRGWSQEKLAEEAGLGQSQISKFEDVDNASWQGRTLKKVAKAFDLRLVVRFESFGTALADIEKLNRRELERPSFKDDAVFHSVDQNPIQSDEKVASILMAAARLAPGSRKSTVYEGVSSVA